MTEENLSEEEKAEQEVTAEDQTTDTPSEETDVSEEASSEEVDAEESSFDDFANEIDATATEEIAETAEEASSEETAEDEEASTFDEFADEVDATPVTLEEKTAEVLLAEAAAAERQKLIDQRRWYSLRVISGKERKIKERIELEIERSGWKDFVTNVLVPTEKVYKIRAGKKVISERNILPGYILVQALPSGFTGEMISAIANVPNVIHFLGRNNPIPMQQSEANRMLGKVDESSDAGEALIEPYIVGETIKIIDGPFSEFVGDIQEVNEEKKKMKVIVKIFGRGTEVELNFMQVEKQ